MSPTRTLTSRRILAGASEAIFGVLPQSVLANLRAPASETALVWNLLYPRATPTVSLAQWIAIPPLAGTPCLPEEDVMTPYFWGYAVDGTPLPALQAGQLELDGGEARTEIDVILLGSRSIVVIEAKNLASLGRCARYGQGRCPEVHSPQETHGFHVGCRYWEGKTSRFSEQLEFGNRPRANTLNPACSRHYQLGRILLLGNALARILDKRLHLWLLSSLRRWPALKDDWEDFAGRIRDDELWRRSRVIAWEAIARLPAS